MQHWVYIYLTLFLLLGELEIKLLISKTWNFNTFFYVSFLIMMLNTVPLKVFLSGLVVSLWSRLISRIFKSRRHGLLTSHHRDTGPLRARGLLICTWQWAFQVLKRKHLHLNMFIFKLFIMEISINTNILPNKFLLTTTKPPSLFFWGNNLKANPKNHIISPLNTSAHIISNW